MYSKVHKVKGSQSKLITKGEIMKGFNEELLSAWLRLSNTICNERIVTLLPYNEALICNILNNQRKNFPGKYLTATDLCEKTRLLKSLMNRTLNSLEEKGLIVRKRSEEDKRSVYVMFNEENISYYEKGHEEVLEVVDEIVNKIEKRIGSEKTKEIVDVFNVISDAALEVIHQ